MKNQKTTITKEDQEFLDFIMREKTPEELEAEDLARQEHFNELHKQFLDQHDWFEKPSVQTKSAAAWTRENILLDSWNQYINCEARMSEFFGDHPEGKGFRWLNDQRRCDIALGFAHYFLASMNVMMEEIDKDLDGVDEEAILNNK